MRPELESVLRCPHTGQPLRTEGARQENGHVVSGSLVTADRSRRYDIVAGVPRFVPAANYASGFGLQWNRFRKTQLDSHAGTTISRDRFFQFSGWSRGVLRDKKILEVGCGAGRFTEIVLEAGAHVTSVDYSAAVDACWKNFEYHPRLNVVQADVYALPFVPAQYDYVFCFGVLQHTPDPRRAFASLPAQLKPGGKLAVDLYPKLALNAIWPKYWLRPLTRRLPPRALFTTVQTLVPALLPVSRLLGRVPRVGRKLRHLIPVANYEGVLPLTDAQIREWAVLDTFDMLAPAHDHPQSLAEIRSWFEDAGMADVFVERMGFNVGRGTKPAAA